ncbi:hypothetical protein FYJ43_08595 [Cutibacterium sp. WCA-380-WT-3A]|uniref:Uncharacterized protein n=1 Tax=Cutibacterium porci TaxID=2605781 RepID=A0A7K0J808_9ACTN|nr:hypothetical protein [Cutibacterium porci]
MTRHRHDGLVSGHEVGLGGVALGLPGADSCQRLLADEPRPDSRHVLVALLEGAREHAGGVGG